MLYSFLHIVKSASPKKTSQISMAFVRANLTCLLTSLPLFSIGQLIHKGLPRFKREGFVRRTCGMEHTVSNMFGKSNCIMFYVECINNQRKEKDIPVTLVHVEKIVVISPPFTAPYLYQLTAVLVPGARYSLTDLC